MAAQVIPQAVWEQIKPVFIRAYPHEAIVAVMPDMSWREIENVHTDPVRHFLTSDEDRSELLANPPLAFIHSHTNALTAEPSDADTVGQLSTGWTWGIVLVSGNPQGDVYGVNYPEFWGDAVPIEPLEGRSYLWGIRDCFSLVRDFYRAEGRSLSNIPRVRDPSLYQPHEWPHQPFRYWIPRLGFTEVPRSERQPGDAFTMSFKTTQDHCGIYLGEGRYLHQPVDKTSTIWMPQNEQAAHERLSMRFYRLPN